MAGQQLAADGGLGDITNLLNLVKDQKSSTSTSTNISKEGVTQQINDILQGTNGLAAVAGAQKTAGLYNGSTNTLLTNDLLARASAQVAAKNATTTTTQTKKASVTKQNIEQLLATQGLKKFFGSDTVVGGAKSVAGSIADELGIPAFTNDTATANALNSVSGAGPGAQVGDFTSLESSLAGGSDVSVGSANAIADSLGGATDAATNAAIASVPASTGDTSVAGLEALDSAATVGAGTQAAEAASFSAGTDAGLAGTIADFGGASATDAAADTAAATGAGLAGDAAAASAAGGAGLGGALSATGIGIVAAPLVGGIAKAIQSGDINDVGDVYGQFGHWVGDRLQSTGDAIGDAAKDVAGATGWIVCTELLRQGKFNRKHYAAGLRIFNSYPRHLLCGYYVWATPLVAALRRNPSSWYSDIVQHVFATRAEYLAARAGVSGARDTLYGQSISALMFGFCWLVGQYLYRRDVAAYKKILGVFNGN